MGIWSTLFGSSKVVNTIADGVYDGLDAVVYTDEEKVSDSLKKADFKIRLLKAYEPFKVAQRFLALLFGIPFVVIGTIAMLVFLFSIFKYGPGLEHKFVYEQLKILIELNIDLFGQPVAIVLGFYFFGGAGEGILNAWSNKQTKK